jgi:hypothetical protein
MIERRWRVSLGALVVVGTSGCGPLGSFRPVSVPISGTNYEVGLGAVTVSPRPYVDERWRQAGQAWFTLKATDWLQLSGISAFDAEALGVGVGATASILRGNRFAAGVGAEVGYGWGAISLPFALRLFEQSWLYGAPRISNYGIDPVVGLPIGLSLHIERGAFLRLEYQSSWVELQAYNLRHHFGAALAVQW